MLKNMAKSLIEHKRINTTLAKAKALRLFVEPLITKAKDNTTHSRRVVFSYLQQKESVKELFDVIGPKILDRPGGYVRVLKTGFRQGDGAETALIELVDFNENFLEAKNAAPKKKRTRRGRSAKSYTATIPATPVAAPADTPEEYEKVTVVENVMQGTDPELDALEGDVTVVKPTDSEE